MRKPVAAAQLAVVCALATGLAMGEGLDEELLRTSNDYLALVEEYWPAAQSGDVFAMTTAYTALNNCGTFRTEIHEAQTIDDLDLLLAHRHASDRNFAKAFYFQCKALVANMDRFPGWETLRFKAALAGDIVSRVWVAFDYYRVRNERPRDSIPYSPAEYLTEAMAARHPMVFGMIASNAPWGPLRDESPAARTAWYLLGCRFYEACMKPESMRMLCRFQAAECTQAENVYEVYRTRAGSDEVFAAAVARADELEALLVAQRYDELGLDLIW